MTGVQTCALPILYERFYLSDSWRMTQLAYRTADTTFAEAMVERFLRD